MAIDMLDPFNLWSVAVLLLITIVIVIPCFMPRDELYRGKIPWVGRRRERFSSIRGNLRSVRQMHAMAFEGYQKVGFLHYERGKSALILPPTQFSKPSKAFALPGLQTGPLIMLPQANIHQHFSMPETVLDHRGPQNAFIHAKYTFADGRVVQKDVHQEVVQKQLTHNLPSLVDNIYEELSRSLEEQWTDGNDESIGNRTNPEL